MTQALSTFFMVNEFQQHWRAYLTLCKPKVVALLVFTALIGMLLAVPGVPPWNLVLLACLGIGLTAASAAAINQIADKHLDALMQRTAQRPLPTNTIKVGYAINFALMLGVSGTVVLMVWVNYLTALLTVLSLVAYALLYTLFLKRATPQNIVIGGVAGAAPPLLGWTAMTGSVDGQALLLFLIIYIWTPPHFWSLAIHRRDDYAQANIPMLPVTHGLAITRLHILLYTILLVMVTLLPFLTGMSGLIYLAGAVVLGLGFLYYAILLFWDAQPRIAIHTFAYSIYYLIGLFAFLLADHYLT